MLNNPNNNETSVEAFDDRICIKPANAWVAHLNLNSVVFWTFLSEWVVLTMVSNMLSINGHFSFTSVTNSLNTSEDIRLWHTPMSLCHISLN